MFWLGIQTYFSGLSTITKYAAAPTTMVISPSIMNIHAHPGLPATPAIFPMAAASNPPKAPAAVAAEKKKAMRKPVSWRGYQSVIS